MTDSYRDSATIDSDSDSVTDTDRDSVTDTVCDSAAIDSDRVINCGE